MIQPEEGYDTALGWKLVIANETIRKAAEALDHIAQAERELADALEEYDRALKLFAVAPDVTYQMDSKGNVLPVSLRHEGATILSLVCHRQAMEASAKYGFDLRRAMEYGFRQWAHEEEGRCFIRYASRKLKYRERSSA